MRYLHCQYDKVQGANAGVAETSTINSLPVSRSRYNWVIDSDENFHRDIISILSRCCCRDLRENQNEDQGEDQGNS